MLKGPLEIREASEADHAMVAALLPGAEALTGDRLLAWAGGDLVGHALAPRVEAHLEGQWRSFGVVSALYVSPEARGFRVGSRLLAHAVERHREAGARGALMRVASSATQAIGMCEHAGFEALSRETEFRVPIDLARSMKVETDSRDEDAIRAEWDLLAKGCFPALRGAPAPADARWLHTRASAGFEALFRYTAERFHDPLGDASLDREAVVSAAAALYRERQPALTRFVWRTCDTSPWHSTLARLAEPVECNGTTLLALGFDKRLDLSGKAIDATAACLPELPAPA